FTSSNAKAAKSKVQAQHKLLKKEMSAKKITFKEGFSYSTVLNGFSASVKANDLNKLLEIEGVTLVEPDSEVHAYEDTSATSTSENGLAMDTSISFLGVE
ncbi:protease inhibitor I9 family protein, partial [Microvirga sp. 3-52]|nr:protease inhibitor I9 family protein [Microvirga sp. 3-52]